MEGEGQRPDLQSDTPRRPTSGQEFGFEEWDIGLAVGGRIVADRLWYFAAADASERVDFVGTRGDLIRTQGWTFNEPTTTEDPDECGGPGTGPGTDCPKGNPNFGTPLDFQRPRTFRFGLKISR